MISAILLAAGRSSRMGKLKQLLPFGSETIVEACARNLYAAGITQVTAVTGHEADRVEAVLHPMGVRCVRNRDYAQGMTGSVRLGVLCQESSCEAVVLALSDQPHVPPALILALIERYLRGNSLIVKPRYQAQSGHPIVLSHKLFPEILRLSPDSRLDALTRRYVEQTDYLETVESAVVEDLDTEQEYLELLRRLRPQQT